MVWYDYVNFGLIIVNWILIFSEMNSFYKARKFWLLFFATYTLTEIISLPFSLKGLNNLWLYNISKPLQFGLLILYFSSVLKIKNSNKYFFILVIALICIYFRYMYKLNEYNSLEDVLYSGIIIVFCTKYFFELIKSEDFLSLHLTEFWYCSSLFIFYGTNFCVTGSMSFLIKNQLEIAGKLFYVLVASSILFYIVNIYAWALRNKLNKLNENGR
jgi:hypothetical protein